MRPRSHRKAGATLLELIAACAVLTLLMVSFYTTLHAVERMGRAFSRKTRAIVLLDNVLERIEARPTASRDELKRILLDEFEKSGLGGKPSIAMGEEAGQVTLSVVKENGKPLAFVRLEK